MARNLQSTGEQSHLTDACPRIHMCQPVAKRAIFLSQPMKGSGKDDESIRQVAVPVCLNAPHEVGERHSLAMALNQS